MNAAEIRQSFLDFFKSKGHQVVKSASLLPESPNLLFTNAGMNQFVPIFLGERQSSFKRAANTQKCIRAGGKHNDLDDVGFDTYHHTFFEMLGNWSFGDYFKKEAISFAWELLTRVWGFPKNRLYVTAYQPKEGEPAVFDQEAYDYWKEILEKDGLDADIHIKKFGKKENFWMMGDTGPCGPCTEIHMDLTPDGNTRGSLVNCDSPLCIEIWNLVFIQFNACGDGRYEELKSKHVDTGMGLERVAGILKTTNNFTDFSQNPSNYSSDLFQGLFSRIFQLCGKQYTGSVASSRINMSEQEQIDFSFRVLADHLRALTFAIADGILPSNEGRHYVLRRILRRAIIFGKRIDFPRGKLVELAKKVIEEMGEFFPELKEKEEIIVRTIDSEEQMFEKTLDRGMILLEEMLQKSKHTELSGKDAFLLYDTYGFPFDLTQLIAAERGIKVNEELFLEELEKQRERARLSQKKVDISICSEEKGQQNEFIGYNIDNCYQTETKILQVIDKNDRWYVLTEKTPFYGEMGGQVGDVGSLCISDREFQVIDTIRDINGNIFHIIPKSSDEKFLLNKQDIAPGIDVLLKVDVDRRMEIQRHHTATHLLNAALSKILGDHIKQSGSQVSGDGLRFDFNHFEALNSENISEIEKQIDNWILGNFPVNISTIAFKDVPSNCKALFNEKYGERVRMVSIGDVSKELCGGCHAKFTGELGLFKIVKECAIAAGIRRIEAVVGKAAYRLVDDKFKMLAKVGREMAANDSDLLTKIVQQKVDYALLERRLKRFLQGENARKLDEFIHQSQEEQGLRYTRGEFEIETANDLRSYTTSAVKNGGDVVIFVGNLDHSSVIAVQCSFKAVELGTMASELAKNLAEKYHGKGGGSKNFGMVNIGHRIEKI